MTTFPPSPNASTYENQKKHPTFSSHLPTTMYDTIVDYFIVFKLITPDITQCTTHFNSWHSRSTLSLPKNQVRDILSAQIAI